MANDSTNTSEVKPEVKSENQSNKASARSIALNQELIDALNQKGSAGGEKPRDLLVIMKDLLLPEKGLSPSEDDKNKLKLRTDKPLEKEGDNSDLMMKIMFGIAGLALIAASGGAGIAVVAGGAAMAPILPEILKKGREFLLGKDKEDGKDGDQQTIPQDFFTKDFPKKMLAVSLLEIANSGKNLVADFIFSKESPFAEKIKAYTDSLSKMTPDERGVELNSLKEEVTKIASNQASNQASTQPDLSKKIDGIFAGLKEVLEGKSSEKKEGEKEGERNILGELKKNLSTRNILNEDGSVTTAVSETKKKGVDGSEAGASTGDRPSTAPASRNDPKPRAEPAQTQPQSQQQQH